MTNSVGTIGNRTAQAQPGANAPANGATAAAQPISNRKSASTVQPKPLIGAIRYAHFAAHRGRSARGPDHRVSNHQPASWNRKFLRQP